MCDVKHVGRSDNLSENYHSSPQFLLALEHFGTFQLIVLVQRPTNVLLWFSRALMNFLSKCLHSGCNSQS